MRNEISIVNPLKVDRADIKYTDDLCFFALEIVCSYAAVCQLGILRVNLNLIIHLPNGSGRSSWTVNRAVRSNCTLGVSGTIDSKLKQAVITNQVVCDMDVDKLI